MQNESGFYGYSKETQNHMFIYLINSNTPQGVSIYS